MLKSHLLLWFGLLFYYIIYNEEKQELYIIAIRRRIFLGSILDDLWCRVRPSEVSAAAFDASFLGGAVTGRVGKAVDQKGSKALRNLWWNGPTLSKMKVWINNMSSINHNFKILKNHSKRQYHLVLCTFYDLHLHHQHSKKFQNSVVQHGLGPSLWWHQAKLFAIRTKLYKIKYQMHERIYNSHCNKTRKIRPVY